MQLGYLGAIALGAVLAGCGGGLHDGVQEACVTRTLDAEGGSVVLFQARLRVKPTSIARSSRITVCRRPAHPATYSPVFELSLQGDPFQGTPPELHIAVPRDLPVKIQDLTLAARGGGESDILWIAVQNGNADPAAAVVWAPVTQRIENNQVQFAVARRCTGSSGGASMCPAPVELGCQAGVCQ